MGRASARLAQKVAQKGVLRKSSGGATYAPTLAGSTQSRSIPSYTYGSRSVGTAHSSRSVRSGATYGRQPSSGKSVAASSTQSARRRPSRRRRPSENF